MNLLSYKTLEEQGYEGFLLKDAPERVIQFGEGNFLRAFVDYFIDVANESAGWSGKVVAVQPISSPIREKFDAQDGLYSLYLRGIENGQKVERKRIISCISRCISAVDEFDAVLACAHNPELRYIVSNTTEAGIVYRGEDRMEHPGEAAFPGKLTLFLYERYKALPEIGFVLLPCELIEENGKNLLACVKRYITLWNLPAQFAQWVEEKNVFCSTLVDRIVPGYPAGDAAALNEQSGHIDGLMVSAEPFGFWAVEGPSRLNDELPFAKSGLPVLVTEDCTPYKQRKVRILNGAHTSTVCAGLLCGLETVGEMMGDPLLRGFLEREIAEEIIPTLDLPRQELDEFAASVIERFQNPFIRHEMISITLNSTSKWRARVLPSVLEYHKRKGELPRLLTFSFAAYAEFFRCGRFDCKDDKEVLEFFAANAGLDAPELMAALCAQELFWGQDLVAVPGFLAAVTDALRNIQTLGMRAALEAVLS